MKKFYVLCVLLVGICCAFQGAPPASASEPVQVVVSIGPQRYVVQQLGGELVKVTSMLPEGSFPGIYEPTNQQMQDLSKADLYVRIKVPYEIAWWEKMEAANPDMFVVDSTEGVAFIEAGAHHHDEGEEHEHDAEHQAKEEQHHDHESEHHGRDPHIWLSPRMMKIQAENIYQGLIAVDPENKDTYSANKAALLSTLESLDAEIQAQLADLKTRKFMIFHPAWSYFARDYDLTQIPIEIEGKEPSAKEMTELMKIAKEQQISVIFVQPQTSRRSADIIAKQIGARVEILDPLAVDWLENMRRVTAILAETLSK